VQRQRDFLRKMLIGPQESNDFMRNIFEKSIKENPQLGSNKDYKKWLSTKEKLRIRFYLIYNTKR